MRRTPLFLLFVVVFLSACPANTPIRRSALVPRPNLPANHGAPIGGAGIRAFGQVNSFRLTPPGVPLTPDEILANIGTEGAAGLWIPTVQFGGGFWGAFNENISIGAQAQYTDLDLAERNLIGVLDFPEEHQDESLFMGGMGLRANFPVDLFTPALIFELNVVSIPQAVFLCDNDCQVTLDEPIPTYTFQRLDRETFLLPNLAFHVTFSPLEYLHVLAMFGGTRGVKNIGFDPDIANLEEDTLEGYLYGYAGAGIEARYEFVYLTAVLFGAFGQPEEIAFGPSATVSVGFVYAFGKDKNNTAPTPKPNAPLPPNPANNPPPRTL